MWRGLHNGHVIRCEPKLLVAVTKNDGKLAMMDFTLRVITIQTLPLPLCMMCRLIQLHGLPIVQKGERGKLGGGTSFGAEGDILSHILEDVKSNGFIVDQIVMDHDTSAQGHREGGSGPLWKFQHCQGLLYSFQLPYNNQTTCNLLYMHTYSQHGMATHIQQSSGSRASA